MTFPAFTPAHAPSMGGTSISEAIRIIENKFGDGYISTSPDGLNALTSTATLVWSAIDSASLAAMLAFLRSTIGQVFYYTLADEPFARKWYVPQNGWQRTWIAGDIYTFSVTLSERFDPDAVGISPLFLAAGTAWMSSSGVQITPAWASLPTYGGGLPPNAYWLNGKEVALSPGSTMLPSSSAGLVAGQIYSNGNVVCTVEPSGLPAWSTSLAAGTLCEDGGTLCVA